MPSIDSLVKQITHLSEQVEQLLLNQDEGGCPKLLQQRQILLEKLAVVVDKNSNVQFSLEYYDFLRGIQQRDFIAMKAIALQKQNIFTQSSRQVQTNKAINTYNKFGD
jgi:hypothetical protein